jgi:Fur family transcriptional regulator, zinc uptake regulator
MTAAADPMRAFPPPGHDHRPCIDAARQRIQHAFTAAGLRLTPLRENVFVEIAGAHQAIGAYDILDRLALKGPRLAPISIYRALDVLLKTGVVHRLESRNAYFACHSGQRGHALQVVLVCDQCLAVAEVEGDEAQDAIDSAARRTGFAPRATLIEVAGLCHHCAPGARPG